VPESLPQGETTPPTLVNPRRPTGLSIQSKLLIMMLGVSLAASAFIGIFGYWNGRNALEAAALDQLTTIREMRSGEIERFFETVTNDVNIDSNLMMVRQASVAFNQAFKKISAGELTNAQLGKIEDFYKENFIDQIEEHLGKKYSPRALMPTLPGGRYLQYHYTASSNDYPTKLAMGNPGDGSEWSAVRDKYHSHFTQLVESMEYEDFLLLDTNGNVVYSVYSGPDLGTNVLSGPFRESKLAEAYEQALVSETSEVIVTDYEWYPPSYDQPTLWVLTPIRCVADEGFTCSADGSDESVLTGVLAAQVQLGQIDSVMTGENGWEAQGLGETGEVYLVGPDAIMRSGSRLFISNPEQYRKQLLGNGTAAATLDAVELANTTVLTQPVKTKSVSEALNRAPESGTIVDVDYTGTESIVAYAPVEVDGLGWFIFARIDTEEAFRGATDFARVVIVSLLFICLLISMLSIVLARVFTRPIERLAVAVHRVSQGELNVQVDDNSQDEVGDLARSFNEMGESLRLKQQLVDEQTEENEHLLHSLMPVPAARKYRDGEDHIAVDRPDVAVVFAELIGFDDYAANMSSEDEISRLRQIITGFNDAAERTGVEPMRTLRGGYLASSGLVTPRVDSAYRAVEFAEEIVAVVERFNAQAGANLRLRVGVDTGRVRSGLIDRTKLAYDLWGDAVALAYRVHDTGEEPGIFVSQAVQERLADTSNFVAAGTLETKNGTETVYEVERP
jgi:class 3 adenylate cyclase